MNLYVVAVGTLKEPFFRAAQEEYLKRLRRYARVTVLEVRDEPLSEKAPAREGERLLKKAPRGALLVALDRRGQMFSSEEFASWLGKQAASGGRAIAFLLGGTLGLAPFVLEQAALVLSLSPLTFPHQLARVVLLEQLYRAFKIWHQEPYHY